MFCEHNFGFTAVSHGLGPPALGESPGSDTEGGDHREPSAVQDGADSIPTSLALLLMPTKWRRCE